MSAEGLTVAHRVLARRATWGRAPSAHNTQPWVVEAAGPDRLVIGWEQARTLPLGDPTGRDLMLSLGCVAEALAIVAADEGLVAQVDWQVDRAARVAGIVRLTPRAETDGALAAQPTMSVAALVARRTARGPFARGATPSEVAAVAPAGGLGLVVLPEDLVEPALGQADRWTFEGPAAGELASWLRLGPRANRVAPDGLTADALGLGRVEAAGLELALRPAVRGVLARTGVTRLLARLATDRPLGTVVALTASDSGASQGGGAPAMTDEATCAAGRALLRTWLAAHLRGLSCHPLSQLIDCPESAAQVADHLGGREPRAVFRLGVPRKPAPRSRRVTDTR